MSIGFPHREHIWQTSLGYLHVREENWRVGTVWLHVLHGVPLVDAGLVGGDPALIVADPGEEQAAWKVVMTTGHLAGFMEWLEGWPVRKKTKKKKNMTSKWNGKKQKPTNNRNIHSCTNYPVWLTTWLAQKQAWIHAPCCQLIHWNPCEQEQRKYSELKILAISCLTCPVLKNLLTRLHLDVLRCRSTGAKPAQQNTSWVGKTVFLLYL